MDSFLVLAQPIMDAFAGAKALIIFWGWALLGWFAGVGLFCDSYVTLARALGNIVKKQINTNLKTN